QQKRPGRPHRLTDGHDAESCHLQQALRCRRRDAGVTVNGVLVKPGSTTLSVLVDNGGAYKALSWFKTYANIKSFLAGYANATNMANMLSAQLLTTEFNICLGKVDPTKSVYV